MESVTSRSLEDFLKKLGAKVADEATFYLLGGSALCLLGSPRETLDVDYFVEEPAAKTETLITELAAELHMDMESVPIAEFVPLPPDVNKRHRGVGRYGQVDVYIYDLYTIALSKIARGFESDLEDVVFLLKRGLIDLKILEHYFEIVLPKADSADILRWEFVAYFETLKKMLDK